MILCYEIPLLPFFKILEANEVTRAAGARKHKKVKKITHRFPSVNRIYQSNRFSGRRFLSTEGKLYKDYIYDVLDQSDAKIVPDLYFEVSYIFFMTQEMMFKKDGDLRDVDVSNMLKAAEDALFEYLQESDSSVLSTHAYKLLASKPKLVILLSGAEIREAIFHQTGVYEIDVGRLL